MEYHKIIFNGNFSDPHFSSQAVWHVWRNAKARKSFALTTYVHTKGEKCFLLVVCFMASCVHTIDFGTSPSDDVDDDDNMLKLPSVPLAIRIERKWNLKTFRASKALKDLLMS